jgi:PadR family transcriptional regulator, regulatory protein PadR
MREPTFHVLAPMLDGPLHGYGIIRRAHELTDGRVRLAAGTLYTALAAKLVLRHARAEQ